MLQIITNDRKQIIMLCYKVIKQILNYKIQQNMNNTMFQTLHYDSSIEGIEQMVKFITSKCNNRDSLSLDDFIVMFKDISTIIQSFVKNHKKLHVNSIQRSQQLLQMKNKFNHMAQNYVTNQSFVKFKQQIYQKNDVINIGVLQIKKKNNKEEQLIKSNSKQQHLIYKKIEQQLVKNRQEIIQLKKQLINIKYKTQEDEHLRKIKEEALSKLNENLITDKFSNLSKNYQIWEQNIRMFNKQIQQKVKVQNISYEQLSLNILQLKQDLEFFNNKFAKKNDVHQLEKRLAMLESHKTINNKELAQIPQKREFNLKKLHSMNVSYRNNINEVCFNNWVDPQAFYFKTFQLHENNIRATKQSSIFGKMKISEKHTFVIQIINFEHSMGIGIADTLFKSAQNVHDLQRKILFYSGGSCWDGQQWKAKQEKGFNKNEYMTVFFDLKQGTVTWKVNDVVRNSVICKIIKDNKINWVPFIYFRSKNDQIRILDA